MDWAAVLLRSSFPEPRFCTSPALFFRRSKGLAICRQGLPNAPSTLTAFALTGCGHGTISPLDPSEWDDHALGGSRSSPSMTAADDQQLLATHEGGVVHYDLRCVVININCPSKAAVRGDCSPLLIRSITRLRTLPGLCVLRQGCRAATPETLTPVSEWNAEARLESLRIRSTTKGQG